MARAAHWERGPELLDLRRWELGAPSRRPSPVLWARVVLRRGALDRALATGVEPTADPALALRAEQLARPAHRKMLAAAVERAVAEVDRPVRGAGASIAVDRRQVAEAAPLLLRLTARLRQPGPFSPGALALLGALLSDGLGPLYASAPHRSGSSPGTLVRAVRSIVAAADGVTPRPVGGVGG